MQFLITVIDTDTNTGTPDEMAAIDIFNDKLVAGGHWIFAGGLTAPAAATVIDNRGGKGLITTGPLIETAEYASGFWVISADDMDTARALAVEGSLACNRKVELRALL